MDKHKPSRRLSIALLSGLILILAACTTPDSQASQAIAKGETHAAAGEYTAAETAFRQAAQQQPDSPIPALHLAQLYADWGRPQSGLAALQQAQQRGASEQEIYPLNLQLLAQAGKWGEVIQQTQTYLTNYPDDTHSHPLLVQAYLQQRECQRAAEIAARNKPPHY